MAGEPEDDSQEWVYNKFAGVTSHSSDESAMSGEQTGSSAPLPGASPVLTRISHTLRSTKRMVDKASMWWGFKFTQGDGCLLQGGSQLATSEAIARIVLQSHAASQRRWPEKLILRKTSFVVSTRTDFIT